MRTWSPFYRMGIGAKVALMIVGMSAVFGAGILGFIHYQLQNALKDEAVGKALIAADRLSVKAAGPVQTGDLDSLTLLLGESAAQQEIAYSFIRDGRGRVLSSSFDGNTVPAPLQDINILKPGAHEGKQPAVITQDNGTLEVIDVASAMAGGALGTAHVGVNMTLIKSKIMDQVIYIMAVGFCVLVVLAVTTLLLTDLIVAPVKDVIRVAEAVGRGDLSMKVNIRTGDEIGRLGETLNRTIDRLEGLVQTESDRDRTQHRVMDLLSVVRTAAEGDLTVKAESAEDALGSLSDAVNLMIGGLSALASHAGSVANEVQRSAGDILQSAERIRSGTGRQAVMIQSTSEAVDTVSMTARRMAENAEAAEETSVKANQAAVTGGAALSETIKGTRRIRAAMQSAVVKIKDLDERAREIGAIVVAIDEIAARTTLLALNAAIEAARAGEQGGRLAVVADEVRRLAERTTRAAGNITVLIKALQAETSDAWTVMEEGAGEAEENARLAGSAGVAFREIEESVKLFAALMADMTRAAADQAKPAERAVDAVDGIARITKEMTNGVQDTVAAINNLAVLAGRLNDALGRFTIGQKRRAPVLTGEHLAALKDSPSATPRGDEIKLGVIE